LYDAFLPHYYWTEVMECLRKLLLTGFVVFFYEGSGLQIFASMIISMVFAMVYNNIKPYLMPSNNTFAIFVHFQVTFTLACTLLLRVNEHFSSKDRSSFQIDSTSLSYALLISNASVLVVGVILILRACFNTSEGDFLDVGFDEDYDEYGEDNKEKKKEEPIVFNKTRSVERKEKGRDIEIPSTSKPQDSFSSSPKEPSFNSPTSPRKKKTTKKKKKKKKKGKKKKVAKRKDSGIPLS